MISLWSELESLCIDRLSRRELITAIESHCEHLPPDLCERLEALPSDQLRMTLLTARLLHLLRKLRGKTERLCADHGC